MAIYRLEAKIIGRKARNKAGKVISGRQVSVVSKAAYRSAERLYDERSEKTFDYKSRSQEVVHSEIVAPDNAPDWMVSSRARLWNAVEKVEKRSDSQLAREFIVALPVELNREQQIEAVRSWCEQEFTSKGYMADFALHKGKDGHNPHAHILVSTRLVDPDTETGFGLKPNTAGKFNGRGAVGHGAKDDLGQWRDSWCQQENAALEAAGSNARVDHRSLVDRGIDREPEPKIGPTATALEAEGIDTERGRLAVWTRIDNRIRSAIQSIRANGEVEQYGIGSTWWERAQAAFDWTAEAARDFVRDESSAPRSYERLHEQQQERNSPEIEIG